MEQLTARRILRAATITAGTGGVLLGGFYALLKAQAAQARRVIPQAEAPPPRGDGLYGPKFPGRPLTMVMLGDSTAAGFGVHRPRETPGALLATGVSRRLRRPVRLYRLAVVGSRSNGLPYQVEAALEVQPDIALIVVGGNDVTNGSARDRAVAYLGDAVRRLRAAGSEVVVGTCPDLGAIQPIKPPLRWLARHWSLQLAAAQTVATVEAGGWTVSLGELMGPQMIADPVRMFAADQFHPSAEGYARAAAGLLPTMLAALAAGATRPVGVPSAAVPVHREVIEDDGVVAATGAEGVRSLPQAAREAVRSAGTEVRPVRVDGRERGPAGRWALLRTNPWFDQLPWFGNRTGAVVAGTDIGGGPPVVPEEAAPDRASA